MAAAAARYYTFHRSRAGHLLSYTIVALSLVDLAVTYIQQDRLYFRLYYFRPHLMTAVLVVYAISMTAPILIMQHLLLRPPRLRADGASKRMAYFSGLTSADDALRKCTFISLVGLLNVALNVSFWRFTWVEGAKFGYGILLSTHYVALCRRRGWPWIVEEDTRRIVDTTDANGNAHAATVMDMSEADEDGAWEMQVRLDKSLTKDLMATPVVSGIAGTARS